MDKKTYISVLLFSFIIHVAFSQDYQITSSDSVGCSSMDVQFLLNDTTGATNVSWNFGNGTTYNGIKPPVVNYGSPGIYTVSATINGSITISKPNYIQLFPNPLVTFSTNDSTLLGSYNILFTVQNQQTSPFDTVKYAFTWDFGDSQSFTTDTVMHGHRYTSAGDYTVTLTAADQHGCEGSAVQTISVEDHFRTCNVFTPNGDGVNDNFIISTNGQSAYSLTIFTRTGSVVYKTESPTLIWNGYNHSGVKMMPGLYYYVVKELNGGNNHTSGFFYMLYDAD
jgi:gliding motility-associated-like protein